MNEQLFFVAANFIVQAEQYIDSAVLGAQAPQGTVCLELCIRSKFVYMLPDVLV